MKNVKIITIILAIILISLVAFGGVYVKTQNRMENKVKEYALGKELYGKRLVEVKVVNGDAEGETKPNAEDLTVENYETVKKSIQNRLNNLGVQDYTVALNKENGTIIVELEENDNTDTYVYYLTASGKVQIKEKDADTELLSDSMVKEAVYSYTANAEGKYQVFMEIELTEEGQAKIEEIKNNYAILADEVEEIEKAEAAKEEDKEEKAEDGATETTTEETENEKEEPTKKIAVLTIAGTEYDIKNIEKNKIRVDIGGETANNTSINNNIAVAAESALLINSGKYPIDYEIGTNRFVNSDISKIQLLYVALAVIIALFITFIILIIKYGINGLLASISCIGFVALLSLILRYTNVAISIEGIGAIIIAIVINLVLNCKILSKIKSIHNVNESTYSIYKDFFLKIIPIIIITVVFSFSGWSNLSSFGMIMFWGLLLTAVYNIVVTKTLLKLREIK